MTSTKKVRVAFIGAGNCASSLVQGVHYYREAQPEDFVPGLMHVNLGGYDINDVEFSAAFDIDQNKVGKDISEAIYAALRQRLPRRFRGYATDPTPPDPQDDSRRAPEAVSGSTVI